MGTTTGVDDPSRYPESEVVKRILYASGSVLTSDQIADVVIEYAQELAKLETSATVTIPTFIEDGSVHEAQLLLGPASQLASLDEDSPSEMDADLEHTVVGRIRGRIHALRPKASPIPDVDLSAADPYDN